MIEGSVTFLRDVEVELRGECEEYRTSARVPIHIGRCVVFLWCVVAGTIREIALYAVIGATIFLTVHAVCGNKTMVGKVFERYLTNCASIDSQMI